MAAMFSDQDFVQVLLPDRPSRRGRAVYVGKLVVENEDHGPGVRVELLAFLPS